MITTKSRITKDHNEIRNWVEERGGMPSIIEGPGSYPVQLKISFPAFERTPFRQVSWDEFFRIFDENDMRFIYSDLLQGGEESRYCLFVRED